MNKPRIARRRLLSSLTSLAATLAMPNVPARAAAIDEAAARHFPFGAVQPPRLLSDIALILSDGQRSSLQALTRGRISALQLMFTGCSATCPLQGALFAQAQAIASQRSCAAQFVSISIDPLADTPPAMRGWLKKFDAKPGWTAATPRLDDLDAFVQLLTSGGEHRPPGPDPHSGQVYLIDGRAQLVYRTPSMPPPERLVALLQILHGVNK